jgi:flagellar hook assembly protein FlgD
MQGQVKLRIYDVLGKEINRVVDGVYSGGIHSIRWDGKSDAGIHVSSGIYFVRLESGNFVDTKKIVLMK